ncbi:MAG TPA: GNAT family N-acetyltransferase [Clostridiales bacterium]|nr:GNAT family N-acetyltransferase [Clostridiales bacterium]
MALTDYIENKPILRTERLTLRQLHSYDIPALKEWMPDKIMYTYWGMPAGKTDKNPELLFEKVNKNTKSFHWGIALNENDKVIGEAWIYLIENNCMAKTALRMAPLYQNQGLGTEVMKVVIDFCFTHTELQRIWTDVDIRNIGSWKVLEKCGFTKEGMIRQGKMVNTWCDYYIYGLLKTDIKL